jgi:hypothetical protein
MASLSSATHLGKAAGRRVQQSRLYLWAVTAGLWAYGLVHLLLAWLTFQLISSPGENSSNEASLATLAALPLGRVLVVATAIGMAALVVWQALQAVFGYSWLQGAKRAVRRVSSGFRAAVYLTLSLGAAQLARGAAPSNSTATAQKTSAGLLALPFGRLAVGLVAAGITVAALDQVLRGVRRTFVKYDMEETPPRWAVRLGMVGWVAKGLVLLVVAGLFWFTALTNNPAASGSSDLALRTLRAQPFGGELLACVAVGFACFGIFCFVWSRHARHDV